MAMEDENNSQLPYVLNTETKTDESLPTDTKPTLNTTQAPITNESDASHVRPENEDSSEDESSTSIEATPKDETPESLEEVKPQETLAEINPSQQPLATETEPLALPANIKVGITFLDLAGLPIEGLHYRITIAGIPYLGTTDAQGGGKEISDIAPNQSIQLEIKKDNGTYDIKYEGVTAYQDMNISAISPYIKVPISTDIHEGVPEEVPAQPIAPKPSPIKTIYPQAGEIKPAQKPATIQMTHSRNSDGHPVLSVKDRLLDWAGRHQIPTFGLWHWHDFHQQHQFQPAPKAKTSNSIRNSTAKSTNHSPSMLDAALTTSVQAATNKSTSKASFKVNSLDQAPPEQLTSLIKIMEEQVTWEWKTILNGPPKRTSINILSDIKNRSYTPIAGKPIQKFTGGCYASVKVGLTRAEITKTPWGDIPAAGAAPWLLSEGFTDVTASVPDGRWALPGDVIVYRYDDETIAKNLKNAETALKNYEKAMAMYQQEKAQYPTKLSEWQTVIDQHKLERELAKKNHVPYSGGKDPQKPKPLLPPPTPPEVGNYGHIEIRTYDGYMSDAKVTRLASPVLHNGTKGLIVTGIYRKVYDPLPDLRVRAFLKVLREWECHSEPDDTKRYYMLGMGRKLNGSSVFSYTSKHPFEGVDGGGSTPSGAYQIVLITYIQYTKPMFGIGEGFTPWHQDRLAVAILENITDKNGKNLEILTHIRKGEIIQAVNKAKSTWSSLPGGADSRHEKRGKSNYLFTTEDLISRYSKFLSELTGK